MLNYRLLSDLFGTTQTAAWPLGVAGDNGDHVER